MKIKLTSVPFLTGILLCIHIFNCGIIQGSSGDTNDNSQNEKQLDSQLTPIQEIEKLFANQDSGVSVYVRGSITSILNDDTSGDAHQRFIIKLSNSQTLLIVHNIDIAPRVTGIKTGSVVYVHGDYIWNSQGGLIHWTHHDPDGLHENGWIIFDDNKFQ